MDTISIETAVWRANRGLPSFVVVAHGIPHYFNQGSKAAQFADRQNIPTITDFETGRPAEVTKEHA